MADATIEFISTHPGEELAHRENWISLGANRFLAVRRRFMVVKRRATEAKSGPLVSSPTIPKYCDFEVSTEQMKAMKYTSELTKTIQHAFTNRTAVQVGSEFSVEAQVSAMPSIKAVKKVLDNMTEELTRAVSLSLAGKRSYEITQSETDIFKVLGKAHSEGADDTRKLRIYYGLFENNWDFYLYDDEHINLLYKTWFSWPRTRETIQKSENDPPLGHPLFTVRFYEPDTKPSVHTGQFKQEVFNSDYFEVLELTTPMPPGSPGPRPPGLEQLAQLAFPVSSHEREQSSKRQRAGTRKIAAARKPAPAAARKVAPARKPSAAEKKTSPGRKSSTSTRPASEPAETAKRRTAPANAKTSSASAHITVQAPTAAQVRLARNKLAERAAARRARAEVTPDYEASDDRSYEENEA